MGNNSRFQRSSDEAFATQVRKVRLAQGVTLADLAAAVGLLPSTISKVELGQRTTTIGEAVDIAEALGVRLADLTQVGPVSLSRVIA